MLFAVRDPDPHRVAFDGLTQIELGPLDETGSRQLLASVVEEVDGIDGSTAS